MRTVALERPDTTAGGSCGGTAESCCWQTGKIVVASICWTSGFLSDRALAVDAMAAKAIFAASVKAVV
jgi:hypothetical protein